MKIYKIMSNDCPESFLALMYSGNINALEEVAQNMVDTLNLAIIEMTSDVFALVLIYRIEVHFK